MSDFQTLDCVPIPPGMPPDMPTPDNLLRKMRELLAGDDRPGRWAIALGRMMEHDPDVAIDRLGLPTRHDHG